MLRFDPRQVLHAAGVVAGEAVVGVERVAFDEVDVDFEPVFVGVLFAESEFPFFAEAVAPFVEFVGAEIDEIGIADDFFERMFWDLRHLRCHDATDDGFKIGFVEVFDCGIGIVGEACQETSCDDAACEFVAFVGLGVAGVVEPGGDHEEVHLLFVDAAGGADFFAEIHNADGMLQRVVVVLYGQLALKQADNVIGRAYDQVRHCDRLH